MKDIALYIDNIFQSTPGDDILLKFERGIVDEWNAFLARVRKSGLKDENVMFDLFLSSHPDMIAEYAAFRKAELKKKREKLLHKSLLIATPVYFLIMVALYLAVSFITHNWRQSWLMIIGFVTVWVDTVGVLLVLEIASKRRLFHPIARVILGLAVMMTAACIYLVGLILFQIPHFWVVFPAGVFLMFCVDAVFAKVTEQKLRIINYLIYVPACAPMSYLVLAGAHFIPWHPGWLIVPLSVIIDVVIIIGKILENRKYIYRPGEEA